MCLLSLGDASGTFSGKSDTFRGREGHWWAVEQDLDLAVMPEPSLGLQEARFKLLGSKPPPKKSFLFPHGSAAAAV